MCWSAHLRTWHPKFWQGDSASEKSDLYAVGMIAYEMFMGKHPFLHEDLNIVITNILQEIPDCAGMDEELEVVITRLLAKDPDMRYADALRCVQTFARLDNRQQVDSIAIRESYLQAANFVGRNAERDKLTQYLAHLTDEKGHTVLLGGESGVGKTRLLDEFRSAALVQGVLVLRGYSINEGGSPYQVWREIIRNLILYQDISDFEASILKSLIPDIGSLIERDVEDAVELDAKTMQSRFIRVVTSMLVRQTAPTLLILEDVHWADPESLTLLEQVTQLVDNAPILILGSYRNDEKPDLPDSIPHAEVMILERLAPDAIKELSTSIMGEQVGQQDDIVDMLSRETDGNAFFIVEVMRTPDGRTQRH